METTRENSPELTADFAIRGGALQALNSTRGTWLGHRIEKAGGLCGPAKGLLGRQSLALGHGMLFVRRWLEPFMCFHTLFMCFPIDIVFLDRDRQVIRIDAALRPWRFSSIVRDARMALELAAGSAAQSGTERGHIIVFEAIADSIALASGGGCADCAAGTASS